MKSNPEETVDRMTRLSRFDLESLVSDPTETGRISVATHIVRAVKEGQLSPDERAKADQILGLMTQDAAVRVREAMADVIASVPDVPRDVILALARDFDRVAEPVLRQSPLLSEAELIEIVKGGSEAKQTAIASRPHVPDSVARTIVEEAGPAPVTALVRNPGAELSQSSIEHAVNRFAGNEAIAESLAVRPDLPVTVAERLVTMVSDRLRAYLVARPDFSDAMANTLAEHSRERAIISLFDDYGRGRNIPIMVEQLAKTKRLTPSLLLRAACTGDMAFLEAAIARRAGLDLPETWAFLHERGPEGLDAVVAAANLPKVMIPVLRIALAVHQDLTREAGEISRDQFRARMIERVLTRCTHIAADDLDYLLLKVDQIAAAGKVKGDGGGAAAA